MKTLLFLSLAVFLVVTDFVHSYAQIDKDWAAFKLKYGKSYKNVAEDKMRFELWMKKRAYIDEHNRNVSQLSGRDRGQYIVGENHMTDWTDEEYKRLLGFRSNKAKRVNSLKEENPFADYQFPNIAIPPEYEPYTNTVPLSDLPATINWTAQGFVNPVENQGQCGDCWAFSAAGALEGLFYNATGKSVILSEQNLLDCSSVSPYDNEGCNGGNMEEAFTYVMNNKGIDTYSSYPYVSIQGSCRYSSANSAGYVTGYKIVQENSEAALQQAVALIGPISVGIDASLISFQVYKSGIYNHPNCNPNTLDHAVLAVGYGTLNGSDYWLLKNSWGKSWGMQGYMMMARNDNNMCGIASDASFPTGYMSPEISDEPASSSTMSFSAAMIALITIINLVINAP